MLHNDRHLTTEQLSAYLDRQLPSQELIQCEQHLAACERCQHEFAGLKQTATLLRSMSPAPLPRSFVLPPDVLTTIKPIPEQESPVESQSAVPIVLAKRRRVSSVLRPAARVLSGLAAVIGVFFLLSALVVMLPNAQYAASTTGDHSSTFQAPSTTEEEKAIAPRQSPETPMPENNQATPTHEEQIPQVTQAAPDETTPLRDATPTLPRILFFDLNLPEGRLSFGMLLLLAGIMGWLVFRGNRKVRQQRE